MINPLYSSSQTAGIPVQMADAVRVVNQPEPARAVTAVETALDARLNSQNAQKDTQHAEPKQLDETLEELNQRMQAWSTGLKFSMDEDAQRLVVSVVDTATGDVIRTVPSDAVLKVAKMIVQMQGQMVDTKV